MRAALILVSGLVAASAGWADTYEGELGVRIWAMGGAPRMLEQRIAIREENLTLSSDDWTGGVTEVTLGQSLGAGLEISYGVFPNFKFLLALEGRGTYAKGSLEGVGSRVYVDPALGLLRQEAERVTRLAEGGVSLGATALLRDMSWARVGLTGRIGLHQLSGAFERWEETGPLGENWWKRSLSGYAPSGFLGLELELACRNPRRCNPVSGFAMAGYRTLGFRRVTGTYTDATGVVWKSAVLDSDGSRRILDFSGPEVCVGLQMVFPVSLERRLERY